MQSFDETVRQETGQALQGEDLSTIQVNVGLRCNLACLHCHLGASPGRTEVMPPEVMTSVAKLARVAGCRQVDITGGAPELNPDLGHFIRALSSQGTRAQVRTNLTVLLEPATESYMELYCDHQVRLVASEMGQGVPAALREGHGVAGRGQGFLEDSQDAAIVIYEEDVGCHGQFRLLFWSAGRENGAIAAVVRRLGAEAVFPRNQRRASRCSKKPGNVLATHSGFLITIPGAARPIRERPMAIRWSSYVSSSPDPIRSAG